MTTNNNNTPDEDDLDYIDFDDDYDDIEDDDDNDDDYSYSRSDNISRHTDNNKKQEYSVVKFIVSEAFSFIKIVIFAAIIALLCTNFIIINAEVPSGSMRDTIWEGDRLFGFRLAYKFSEPKRGDVIIFKYPDNESENYVKRVIGLPNEIVQIKEGYDTSMVMSLMSHISKNIYMMTAKHTLILFLTAVILCLVIIVITPKTQDTGLTHMLRKKR